jgi:hypothetical protein
MEDVVPFVPYLFDNNVDIMSPNVTNYSFDQFAGLAAFDQLAVSGSGNLGCGWGGCSKRERGGGCESSLLLHPTMKEATRWAGT